MPAARSAPAWSQWGKVALAFDTLESARVRMVISPGATAVSLGFEVVAGLSRGIDPRCARELAAAAAGIDLSPFAIFRTREIPNALMTDPVGAPGDRTFEAELAAIRALDPAVLRAEILDFCRKPVPPEYTGWIADPASSLARFADALEAWWACAIRPHWDRARPHLDAEVARLARLVMIQGVEEAIVSVHPSLQRDRIEMFMPSPRPRPPRPITGPAIYLVPMACGPEAFWVGLDRPDGCVAVGYGIPGTGGFGPPPPARDGVAALIGPMRAELLERLDMPLTTTQLARLASAALSTVSEHLKGLRSAGLVEGRRTGRCVYYGRTPRGDRLLALF